LNKTPFVSKTYFKDAERVQNEIWKDIDVRDKTVIDVGIGESTEKLVELGAKVIGVDNDFRKIMSYRKSGIPLILCDFINFPFHRRIADIVVFYFTLHEICPCHHHRALITARKIAPTVIIVEPSSHGCLAYREFARLWRDAMNSVGKFEEYMPAEYWEGIVRKAGFDKTLRKTVKWKAEVPIEVLGNIITATINEWKDMGVGEYYIKKLQEFLKENPRLTWSNIEVIIGKSLDV